MKTQSKKKMVTLCLIIMVISIFAIPMNTFAEEGYVTASVVPLRTYGIFGRKDYPAVKTRITLAGAIEGNRNDMINGSSMTFKVNKTNAGQLYAIT